MFAVDKLLYLEPLKVQKMSYVNQYKYLVVDESYSKVLASFDYRSDLTKWLLNVHHDGNVKHATMWVCRMAVEDYQKVMAQMKDGNHTFSDLIAVRKS